MDWIKKEGYETLLLFENDDLESQGTQIQKVIFKEGKYKHFHKIKTEFFYILEGFGNVIINDKVIKLKKGTNFVVKPNEIHEFIVDKENELHVLMVKTNNSDGDTYKI